ncbi:MAG: hypothetical protein Q4C56_01560 [Peptococcaceae bacterium]|nr:hypothetical protein [Peptococcaceae bacterium]
MMLLAAIPVKWALFFTGCLALAGLFFVIRALVFYIAGRIVGKDE